MKFIVNPKFADRPGMQVLIFVLSVVGYLLTLLGILFDTGRAFRKMKTDHALALKFTACYYVKFVTHMLSLFSYALNFWYNTPVVFAFDLFAAIAFGVGIVAEIALSYRVHRYLEDLKKRRAVLGIFVATCVTSIGVILNSLSFHDLVRFNYIGVSISIASSLILVISLWDMRVMWESNAIPEMSWLAYIFGFSGSLLTLIDGIVQDKIFDIIRSAIALVLNGIILVVMVRYHTTRGQLSLPAFFSSPYVRLRDALHHLSQVDVRGRLRDWTLAVRGFFQQYSPSTPSALHHLSQVDVRGRLRGWILTVRGFFQQSPSAVPAQESPAEELPTQEIELAPV